MVVTFEGPWLLSTGLGHYSTLKMFRSISMNIDRMFKVSNGNSSIEKGKKNEKKTLLRVEEYFLTQFC